MGGNSDVAAFLRSRRAGLQPSDVGLGDSTSRRTPGLRREEVAMLAGVSVDYYARLEQGRDLQPCDQVLDAIARALQMNEIERNHLVRLVRGAIRFTPAHVPTLPSLRESTRLLLDSLETPALVLDARGAVQGINSSGEALLVGLTTPRSTGVSHTRWLFLDAAARSLLVDWAVVARFTVHRLREAAGRYPQDPALQSLIGELSIASVGFRTWWAEHDVAARCHGLKRFHHPLVGNLELHIAGTPTAGRRPLAVHLRPRARITFRAIAAAPEKLERRTGRRTDRPAALRRRVRHRPRTCSCVIGA